MIKESSNAGGGTAEFTAKADVFRKYLPSAQIEVIQSDKIPHVAVDFFEFRNKQFIDPKDYKPGNFDKYFLIRHDSGEITYAAQQRKTYWSGSTEIITNLIDFDQSGDRQGDGEIRYDPTFKGKPFVGWSGTEDNYQMRGLGIRRLLMMNALSQILHGLPLHSSNHFLTPRRTGNGEKGIWEKLLSEGKVDKYKEGEQGRYVFKV